MGRVRLLLKKRGNRWTGSAFLGSVGEGLIFAALVLVGGGALTMWLASRLVPIPGWSELAPGTGPAFALIIVLASLLLIGLGGLGWTVFRMGTSQERRSALAKRAIQLASPQAAFPPAREYPTIPRNEHLLSQRGSVLAIRLPLRGQPTWSLLGASLFCLMWNGLAAGAVFAWLHRLWQGQWPWLLTVPMILLAYVAVRSSMFAWRRWHESLGIGPTYVEVNRLPFRAGESFEVAVIQYGKRPMAALSVTLACDEEAKYREGTDVRIERRRASEFEVMQSAPTETPWIGRAAAECPPSAMHSFQSSSNAIEWSLCVRGKTEDGRSWARDFAVVVFPP